MERKTKNIIVADKSKAFALRIIKLYTFLREEKSEYVLSRQVLRSGTSVGANIRESRNAQSDLDFISKMSIALKEADETAYWLELLYESEFITQVQFDSLYKDIDELIAMLTVIIKTKKENLNN
jgi:four helix bundle protein